MGNDVSKKNSYELELTKNKVVSVRTFLKKKEKNENKGKIKTTRTACWKFGFSLLAFLFVINVALAIIMWGTNLYNDSIHQIVTFHEGGLIFKLWKSESVPRYISVYPFNYTNTEDIKARNHVPHVQQLGPFVFREKVERVNIKFNENGTLTYQENRTHFFVPEQSNGSLSDIIVLPNFPVLAAHNMEDSNMLERSGVSLLKMVSMPSDFLKVTVNDIIWGHDDRFSRVASALKNLFKKDEKKFGILTLRNGLSSDRVTLGTGILDMDKFAVITRYNGHSTIGAWEDEQCDKIGGTDGSIFPYKLVVPNTTLSVYAKEMCRKLPMEYEREVVTDFGVPANRYRMPGNVFECADKYPANKCYCRKSVCPPCGTFNTAPCNFRLPVFVSFPHFTHADPTLREKVSGLTPDPDKYQTYIDVHKYGVTVNGISRIQINFFLNQSSNHPWFNLADGTVLPLAWIELKNGEFTNFLKFLLFNLSYTGPILEVSLRYGSILMIFMLPYFMYRKLKSGKCGGVNLQ